MMSYPSIADLMADFLVFRGIPFLVVAFLYASVGHGGASGYLALLSIFLESPMLIQPIALILNLVVSGIAFVQFYRQNYFQWRLFLPIALFSIPMAFLGGLTPLKEVVYLKSLGVFLLVSVLFLNVKKSPKHENEKVIDGQPWRQNHRWAIALPVGGVIGYLSGLLGIGGGILLSPVLLLLGWTKQKQTASISTAFIFVNSAAGLMGFVQKNPLPETFNQGFNGLSALWQSVSINLMGLLLPVVLGGILGSWYGAKKFNQQTMKFILSVVLMIAAIKLLL